VNLARFVFSQFLLGVAIGERRSADHLLMLS